jgi:hypothetical protein
MFSSPFFPSPFQLSSIPFSSTLLRNHRVGTALSVSTSSHFIPLNEASRALVRSPSVSDSFLVPGGTEGR